MKKKSILIGSGIVLVAAAATIITAVSLSGCDEKNEPSVPVDTETKENETKVTVNFNVDGGTNVESIVINKGEKIEEPTVTKENTKEFTYEFAGWYTSSDFSVKFDFNSSLDENITLYAKWNKTVNKYTVSWLDSDETLLKSEELNYGTIPSFNPGNKATAEYTYTFVGWNTTPVAVTSNVSYKAVYTPAKNAYNVTWKNGETILKVDKFDYGVTPSYTGLTPTKEATDEYTYEFVGWTPDVNAVTGDVTYVARFSETKNKYAITFKNGDTVLQSTDVEYGATPAYNGEAPTKESDNTYNYEFDGWNEEIVSVTGEATYTAKFKETYIEYTVSFVDYDNKEIDTKTYHYGDLLVAPSNPLRESTAEYSYTFDGWDNEITSNVVGNVTYKATYKETKNKYTIIWMNGDTLLKSDEIEYGKKPEYTGATPEKTKNAQYSYTFIGWNEEIVNVTGNATYTAKYQQTLNKYNVLFKNGDTVLQSTDVEYGATPVYSGSAPTKESDNTYNYEFDGWNEEIVSVTGEAIYTAKFKETYIEYTVSFVDYDNTEIDTKTYHYGDLLVAPLDPVRESTAEYSYTFDGWDNEITSNVVGNVTYKATYKETKNKYTIIFKNGDTVLQSSLVEYGVMPSYTGTPVKEATTEYTYTFAGWDSEIVAVTGEKTYKALFNETKNKYTITFKNGDVILQTLKLEYGVTPVYSGEAPVKESNNTYKYNFTGWDSEIVAVTGEKTYKAKFDEVYIDYTVTFVDYDNKEIDTKTYHYGDSLVAPTDPVRESTAEYSYTFDGWDNEVTSNVVGNVTYKATYKETKRKYKVDFNTLGGSLIDSALVEYGLTVSMPSDPTLDGKHFEGWYKEEGCVNQFDFGNVITEAIVLYAKWVDNPVQKYLVTFVLNNGNENISANINEGTKVSRPSDPTKEATVSTTYTFDNWYADDNFSTPFNFDSEINSDTLIYAKYIESTRKYTITFKNGDMVLQSSLVEYGKTPEYNGITPTKNQTAEYTYTFACWDSEISTVNGEKTYNATYTETLREYTITWLDDDGTLIDTVNVKYGITPTHANPTKDATAQYSYTFTGWDSEIVAVTGAKTYKATYSENLRSYEITWLNDNDDELAKTLVFYGQLPTYPNSNPTKDATAEYSYTFAGWDSEIITVTGAKTYKATYNATVNKYTIIFKNGDISLQTTQVEYGKMPEYKGATPTKNQTAEYTYTFAGWDSEIITVTGAKTYNATYTETVREYTITWKDSDGTVLGTDTLKYGAMPTHADPEKEKTAQYEYTFDGWTPEVSKVTGAVTYTATYTETLRQYDITWLNYDGSIIKSEKVNYGTLPVYSGETPTREKTAQYTYEFDGWEPPLEIVTASTSYRATYKAILNRYTVTFKNGDVILQRGEYNYNQTPAYNGPEPTKSSTSSVTYTFKGWNKIIGPVTSDTVYEAVFESDAQKYTITFKNGDTVLQSGLVEYGQMPVYSGLTPTKEATAQYTYTFTGWDSEISAVSDEKTYNAVFSETVRKYIITWLNDDGTLIDSVIVEYGENPTHANPVKDSTPEWEFTFVGWNPQVSAVTGDITYTATYTSHKRSYTVTFKNDDTVLQSGLVEYGNMPEYTGLTPTKESTAEYTFEFIGWNTTVSNVTGDVTYVAQFNSIIRQYTYTFLSEDGNSAYKTITANYGTNIIKPNDPSKASDLYKQYTFIGWYTAITGGTKVTEFGTLEANVAYYARFSEENKLYTIRWMDGSIELATSNNASYDSEYPNGTPTKNGYTFGGWEEFISGTTITRTAIFSENNTEYTVTWLNDDGSLLRVDTVSKNDKASYGTKPSKSGYKFLYWEKDGVEFDLNTNVTSNLTLKAVYAEIIAIGFGSNYTPWSELVTEAGANSTTDSSGRYLLNTEVSLIGYTFENNNKNRVSKDGSQYNNQGCDIIVTLSKEGSLFASASWGSTNNSGYITITNSSNNEVYKSSLISGSGTNCSFEVEDLEAGTYRIHSDYSINYNSLYYEIAKEYRTVSYVTNIDGVTIDASHVVLGMTLDSLPELQKDNYKFIGWYTEPVFNNLFTTSTIVNENVTLYAKWEQLTAAEKATVTFATNVSGIDFDSITIEKGKTITLPSRVVDGYRFDNWYTTNAHSTIFNPNTVINGDITIYANYIKQWTITYKDKDNNIITTEKVDNETQFGEVAAISAPYVDGYLFDYWAKDGVEYPEGASINSNIILVAHYKKDDGTSEKISITKTEGLQESAYILFDEYDNADNYALFEIDSSNNTKRLTIKNYCITNTKEGLRADLFGLTAGSHKIMIVPEISGTEVVSLGSQTTFSVEAYDRSGYAHFNYTDGVGAYNDDGTIKNNAIVLYVTDQNKNTVELTYGGITVKGIGNILNTVGKECGESGHEGQCKMTSSGKSYYGTANTNQDILKKLAEDNIPLIVRFVGTVSESGLYKKGTFNANSDGLIDGLTGYDSVEYGGSVGDNGHMARMKSGKNITLEGVGSDATIDGWGFHFMCESSNPNLGKNFEVRNLKFINTPEDAVGMEGVQSGSTITASVERCWIHNNEFYSPDISSPAESDKSEGDGSCDFKRGMYFTCSYNYFEGCHKTNLVGSSDSSLQYNLTYHHNYWYLCKARGPLTRQANVHMYNNIFYGQTDFCMNTRANAYIFSESNLFYACKNPYRVDAGAIKSYNDSVSSALYNTNSATVVNDINTVVSSSCAYNGVSYSSFELNSNLFYKNDYYLQSDPTDAKKVIYARCGTSKASLPAIESVTMPDISYVNEVVSGTTVNNLTVGNTTTVAKISKTIYAFKITESATATITYESNEITATGVLCNEAGVALLTASGTVKLTPGIYFIQPFNFGAGDSKTLTQPQFKELKNFTIKLEQFDDSEYQNQLISEFNALVNALPSTIEYNDNCYGKIQEAYLKYEQLNSQSKVNVATSYNILNNAYNTYKAKGISYVEGLINSIVTPVTEANANKVYQARAAYNELVTKVPSATVSNYNKLTSAEKELESIAVNLFLTRVSELPSSITYSSSCLEKIQAAENAYDALTDDQKKLEDDDANVVDAYETLKAARATYNSLEAEANKITITFMVDGTTYSTSKINKNTLVSLPADPAKSGYRFDGWYLEGLTTKFDSTKAVSESITLYAKFVEQIRITFYGFDGTTIEATRNIDKNGTIASGNIPNAQYVTGYKFKYWSSSKNGQEFDFSNTFTSNASLYAVYEVSNVSTIDVSLYGGDLECVYAEFNKLDSFTDYNAYIKKDGDSSFTLLDKQLIRQYSNYYRVDAVGLDAGNYSIKIVPFANNAEVSDAATTITNITVKEHIRTGFAFVNGTASGAYNEDGTLRSDAQVIYVSNSNKDTVTLNTVDKKGAAITVTGLQNIITNLKSNTKAKPLCIRILGNITDPDTLIKGDLYIDTASVGLTIEGIGKDATINGFGIVMKNSSNVEVRNLGFMNCNSSEGDSVGLQQGNDHCWVHNCDFFYGDAGSDADQVKGDGALDTKTSSYITHSFNHFYDTGKSNLQGMKSESTSNYITYHHNWYDHSDSRHPRIRTCTVHIYNNYFDGNAKYGVGVTMGASAFVENNYFRSTAIMKPMLSSMQGTDAQGAGTFSGETGGMIKAYGNKFDGKVSFISQNDNATSFDAYVATLRNEVVSSSYTTVSGGTTYNNFDTNSSLMYSYEVETADECKNTVTSYAGRVQGGDFTWNFNNSVDDAKYAVDTELKAALVAYKGTLISVLGIDSSSQGGETPSVDTSVQDVIDMIAALPEPANVTLANTDAIYAARTAYQKLSATDQANVTNYSKLQQCISKLNELGNDDDDTSSGMIYFDASKKNYTITGVTASATISGYKKLTDLNLSSGVTYGGHTYESAAKFDSGSSITLTLTSSAKVTVYAVGKSAGTTLKVGDNVLTTTAQIAAYSYDLNAGTYTIQRSSGESYIFLIVVE